VRQRSDAQREAETLQAQNAGLAEELSALKAQVAQLRQPPAPAQPANPFGTTPQPAPAVAPTGTIDDARLEEMVRKTVEAAVAPVTQFVSQSQRSTANQRKFSQLAREHPQLADTNSELHQAFSSIWDNDPDLQAKDNGLEFAVYAALGAVGSTPGTPAGAQKTAAAVTTPRTAPQNLLPPDTSDVEKVKELKTALESKGAQEGLDDREWEALLGASLGAQTPE
jgi:cell division protein FtsB